MKGGCSVGDGARTCGVEPLVPFWVVVTLSETEVLQFVLRVLDFIKEQVLNTSANFHIRGIPFNII